MDFPGCCCCSVAKLCPTLCNPMNCSMPVFPVLQYLLEFGQTWMVKNLPAVQETWVQEDPLEKEMGTHSSILIWRISWTEEPGRLESMGLQKVGHD